MKGQKIMKEVRNWYLQHKTICDLVLIGVVAVIIYHIGYGFGSAVCRVFN